MAVDTENFKTYYNTVREAVRDGAFRPVDSTPDSYYFHYTSLDVLMKIISNQELWATDAKYLNDEEEFQFVLSILKMALDTRFGYHEAGCVRFREGVSKYINGTSGNVSGMANTGGYGSGDTTGNSSECIGDNAWRQMTELFGESFVICFSTERDNLTLWSEFANQGCCLELNLWNILNSMNDSGIKVFSHGRVIYDPYTQRKIIDEALVDILELFFPGCDIHAGSALWGEIENLDENAFDSLIGACMAVVRYKGMFFKRHEFYAEKEYRLIVHLEDLSRINHIAIKGMIRPYIKVSIVIDSNLLKSVTLAPYNVEIAAQSVEDYLRLTDSVREVPVKRSVIKLRY